VDLFCRILQKKILDQTNRDQAIILHQSLMMRGDLLTIENRTDEANRSYQMAHEIMMGTI